MDNEKSSYEHPESPPEWLAKWPAEAQIREWFSQGIRDYAWRVIERSRPQGVEWTANALSVNFGHQRATWRLTAGGWKRSCSCGYINDRCAHLYLVAKLFAEIRKANNWGTPGQPAPVAAETEVASAPTSPTAQVQSIPSIPSVPSLPSVPSAPPTAPRQNATTPAARAEHPDLFKAVPLGTASAGPQRLEVEVDLAHVPGQVTLRFYHFLNDRRNLLLIRDLLKYGNRLRNDRQPDPNWPEADRKFLVWFSSRVDAKPYWNNKIEVFKIASDEFKSWLEIWADSKLKIIDRQTQAAITQGNSAASLHFELANQGDWVEIAAIITAPSGKCYRVHEIFAMLAAGHRDMVLDGHLLECRFPVSRQILSECFARKSPRMKREHVPHYLPVLLEGRLDLLRGPTVQHREEIATPVIEAEPDGADIRLRVRLGDAILYPGGSSAPGGIVAAGDNWVITTCVSPLLETVQKFLKRLPLQPEAEGRLRLPGTVENVAKLATTWVELPGGIDRRAVPALSPVFGKAAAPTAELKLRESRTFLDLQLGWQAGGTLLSEGEIQEALKHNQPVLRTRSGGWLKLDLDAARDLRARLENAGLSVGPELRTFRPEAGRLLGRLPQLPGISLHPASAHVAERLRKTKPVEQPHLPELLKPVLRDYQKQGYHFLADRSAWHVGAILADDMGLGKTLQVLALLLAFFQSRKPSAQAHPGPGATGHRGALVICPASVVAVWLEQAARFCPELRCRAYQGTPDKRDDIFAHPEWDVLVTNYALVRNDAEKLLTAQYEFVVLDEAQQIKNPDSQIAQIVRRLRTPRPLALTGTPLENRLLDLWSIMDFVNPGFLGSRDEFLAAYDTGGRRNELSRRIAPVMLRRLKEAVASELPPRTEEVLRVEMSPDQRQLYNLELLRAREAVKDHGPMQILAALTRLRQVCCDPRLLPARREASPAAEKPASAKLEQLLELVDEITGEGHSVLIFSQFTSMLDLIEKDLAVAGTPYSKITGDTPVPERARLVKEFQDSTAAGVFLLSLKAAGTGLTLTKADYVIIYDPWWNPAVERQAIDRTHRIGQDKPVIAYRLVVADTVEDKILLLQQEKAELFAAVMEEAEQGAFPQRLTAADLEALLV